MLTQELQLQQDRQQPHPLLLSPLLLQLLCQPQVRPLLLLCRLQIAPLPLLLLQLVLGWG
jgi:hypothetical protein